MIMKEKKIRLLEEEGGDRFARLGLTEGVVLIISASKSSTPNIILIIINNKTIMIINDNK